MVKHVRWYVNVAKWAPTKEEWLKLTSSIASEEIERINRFVFQGDAKSSLIGCALIQKYLSDITLTPSHDIVLTRNSHGRPEICESYRKRTAVTWPSIIDFNVSHSGDYCILGGVWSEQDSPGIRIGADVTKVVSKKTKPELDRFFDLMSRRPFTRAEWALVEKSKDDRQKCINFTRLWCLKESFIKAVGIGLSFGLDRIDFRFCEHSWNLSTNRLREKILDDTTVIVDGKATTDWRFCETSLDDEHIVALGYNIHDDAHYAAIPLDQPFEELPVSAIADSLSPMRQACETDWNSFVSKKTKSNQ